MFALFFYLSCFDDSMSAEDMTPAESWELTRHLATQLGSSFALPRGSKCSVLPQDYCAAGLAERAGFLGGLFGQLNIYIYIYICYNSYHTMLYYDIHIDNMNMYEI